MNPNAQVPPGGTNPSEARTGAALAAANDELTPEQRKSVTRGPIRMGFWVLVVGFGLFLLWAAWAPLDEGVSAPAVVSVESKRKTIQHMQGGVIERLLVKDATEVKAGDVLIVLDSSGARAAQQAIRQNYLAQRALEGRLLAEAGNQATIEFHSDLTTSTDPLAQQHMAVQRQLFAARRDAQAADRLASEQVIAGFESQLAGARSMLQGRKTQAEIQQRQLTGLSALAEEGFAPRNQALQLQQSQQELRAGIADLEATTQRVQASIGEQRLRLTQRRQETLKEVAGELANVRREVQANQERLQAVTVELARLEIRAPIAGQVLGVSVAGPGGVVQPGQHLMDILPLGDTMLLQARVPPHVIDRVKAGDEVEVRFAAFAHTPHLVVTGKLSSLGGDIIQEATAGALPYYPATVRLTAEGMKALGPLVVKPGMNAEVLIRTGERSLLTYLLHPLTKRLAASMTEQ